MIHFRMSDYYFYSGFGEIFIFLLLIAFSVGVFVLMTVTKRENKYGSNKKIRKFQDSSIKTGGEMNEASNCYFCQSPSFDLVMIYKISEKKRVPVCENCMRERNEDY